MTHLFCVSDLLRSDVVSRSVLADQVGGCDVSVGQRMAPHLCVLTRRERKGLSGVCLKKKREKCVMIKYLIIFLHLISVFFSG